ncbi:multidrug effflux MFS transporter [uncultured Limnohabitans sp.]|jgi:MFS transporter, DHA1 family, multidrug resistance protein|uniref:multidrug effflux MFS transporter n=1 Tax=uncultured Limnohabitans sp. TaxID=768543 RepID=UPI001B7C458E|nr:multidrug effflux MFS transporter [uncultured Limnohabitans sp.]MBP6221394.1 multidrug effflux MFS transporter [Limnohabitans sp.]
MPQKLIVLILALLLGLQPVTTDLYLPALPAITQGFGAGMGQAQLTLTALLLAFGLSQLVWGPLSDRFGRRPILLWGMAAYTASSVACALAPSMAWLIAGRTLQGIAMGAGVMAARAVVRDLFQPAQGATVMSQGLTGLGIIACACAPLGGMLTDWLGWRIALLMLAVFGAATLALVYWRFEETLARPDPHALSARPLIQANLDILRNPVFLTWCALSAGSYLGLFTFLASSSFVFVTFMGYSKTAYGFLMLSMSLSYIVGTFWCRWMLRRTSVHRTVGIAAVLTITGGVSMTALAYAGQGQDWYGAWAVMGPMYIFMLGHGVHQPCGQSGAVAPFPNRAGTASALNGFLMMLGAFFIGGWLGTHMDRPVFALAHGLLLCAIFITFVAWTGVQRHGRPVVTSVKPT